MSDKLNINTEMAAFDTKDRQFYDNLTDEERKKFSTYLMIRWGSSVEHSNPDMMMYYIQSCNQKLNKNFFDISRHPKLQWLCATTVSPNLGKLRHKWIALKKRESNSKAVKFIKQLYPQLKQDEIELLAQINDRSDLESMARELGWSDDLIKKELK